MATLAVAWQSAKVVRTREKITFFFGVMSLLASALLFGMAPECVLLLSCLVSLLIYFPTQMGSHIIYAPSALPSSYARLQVQETRLALFPLRPLLLRHDIEFHLHLGAAVIQVSFRRLLLPEPRLARERGHHMAQQSRIPRYGQGHVALHPHLPAIHVYSDTVRILSFAQE